ncbi:U-box domain-containing protein 52 [Lolium perenne]|uniref:U-box domain-containing protein 52 n=1 Tax=Lolium perenne TaxID=4522 RepID=UPI0021F5BB95|nr:U-box domain-containing protein 52-like [Lolium perenne]
MAARYEPGTGAPTVGLALSGSKSSAYVLQWALAKFAPAGAAFRLIHVLTPVLAVPTELGNYIPIDKVRPDKSDAYVKMVQLKAQEMLARCKNMCNQNKVEAQMLLVNGSDVADTISNLVAQYQIQILVVGNPTSRSAFTRKSSGSRTSSKICKSVPSFCTAYVVSKDGLSSVYAPESEIGSPSGSRVPKGSCSSSSSELFSDGTSSISDMNNGSGQGLFGFPRLPSSNSTSENLGSSSSAEGHRSFTLYDYLTGNASYNDKDRRIASCTGAESSVSSKLWGSDKVPMKESSLQGLILSDNKDDVNAELEKLRLELRHKQGAYKLVQDESVDASHQVDELAARRVEGEVQLREIQSRVDKANDEILEGMAHRCAAEEVTARVKDLVRAEVMQKNRLLAQASKDADQKSKLEQLFVLQGNSYSTFSWEEIDNATSSFSESRKIGTGSNGTVYKGYLNHLDVAIKVLHSNDRTSTKHFNQELEVLSRIRHPHLLMLLGAYPDRGCLVYEYMENGSLADRLQRINGTPPIPWFHRFRIAWEIVSALVFLHSTKPSPIIHRDLKPENVLLDVNLVSKIGDVGLSTLVPLKESLSSRTVYKKTGLAGTLFYLDPEYQRTGQVSVKSDTYSFGMVILQLLTARPPIGLPELVERAVEDGKLRDILDESAGNWPLKETNDLAQLGLSCLEMRSKNRPDLRSVVAVELERLKHIVATASEPAQAMPGLPGPPSHFMCPILKRVMQDPCIATDGYSYERNAIEMWLCENDVSPMTKARLPDKTLVPNRSLLCAITSWRSEGGDI